MTSAFPRSAAVAARLDVLDETPSTNDVLVSAAADAAAWPDLSVVVTDTQTAGCRRRTSATTVPLPTPDGPESTVSRAGVPETTRRPRLGLFVPSRLLRRPSRR